MDGPSVNHLRHQHKSMSPHVIFFSRLRRAFQSFTEFTPMVWFSLEEFILQTTNDPYKLEIRNVFLVLQDSNQWAKPIPQAGRCSCSGSDDDYRCFVHLRCADG